MRTEVLIVGGGPAGATLALCLRRRGFDVVVLEREPVTRRRVGETLSSACTVLLKRLGLFERFLAQKPEPAYLLRSAWQDREPRDRDSIFDPNGHAFHVDRLAFDRELLAAARAQGAIVREGASAAEVERLPRGYRVRVHAGASTDVIESDYLIDATGRRARVARKLGAERLVADRLVAVARWFEKPEPFTATLVEAVPDGYWYSAPLPGSLLVAVWFSALGGANAQALRAQVWQRCLDSSKLTQTRLRGASSLGQAGAYDASPSLTQWQAEPGFLAVGDAAASFDPVTGNGLCFALQSAIEAASTLERTKRGDRHASDGYRTAVRQIWQDHLQRRQHAYGLVQRFPESEFWRARSGTEVAAPRPELLASVALGSHPE